MNHYKYVYIYIYKDAHTHKYTHIHTNPFDVPSAVDLGGKVWSSEGVIDGYDRCWTLFTVTYNHSNNMSMFTSENQILIHEISSGHEPILWSCWGMNHQFSRYSTETKIGMYSIRNGYAKGHIACERLWFRIGFWLMGFTVSPMKQSLTKARILHDS